MSEELDLHYPLYSVRHGDGFSCLPGHDEDGNESTGLVLFSKRKLARTYALRKSLPEHLFAIRKPHHLRDFLRTFGDRITDVLVDPEIDRDGNVQMEWSQPLQAIIEALPEPSFVWDYPVFLIRVGLNAYASIDGTGEDGASYVAIGVFTDQDLAERWAALEESSGVIKPIASPVEFARFLRSVVQHDGGTSAVAFDLTSAAKGRLAKVCITISRLLEDLPPDPQT